MKIWVDDTRKAPEGYLWCKSVNEAKEMILIYLAKAIAGDEPVIIIDLDHDAGDYAVDGGDYIKLLDWLEESGYGKYITFRIHSQNPVGRNNMERIILKNGWRLK